MKIKKGKFQQIIREEVKRLVPPSVWADHGSNTERQRMLKELGNIHSDNIPALANASVAQIENLMDQWETTAGLGLYGEEEAAGGADPRADQVYDLLFQVRERLMAILENRD